MLVFHGLNNQAEASRSHPELITITQIKSTVLGAVLSHSVVSDSCDPVDCSRRAPLSMGFSRQEYWSGYLPSRESSSRESSQPRDWTQVSWIAGGFFTIWATREAQESWSGWPLRRIFPTQKSNRGLLHCRWILELSYQGSPLLCLLPSYSHSSTDTETTKLLCAPKRAMR